MSPGKKKNEPRDQAARETEAAAAPKAEEPQGQPPAEEDVNGLRTRLQQAEEQCDRLAREREEYLQLAQRVKADFDNYRKRNAGLRAEAFEDGACAFIENVLPVCDNLERAAEAHSRDPQFKEGVTLVLRQLNEVLEKRGVGTIDRPGEPFDPRLEDAVGSAEPGEGAPGTVAQVIRKGYRLGDRVLRHAMVLVVREDEAPES